MPGSHASEAPEYDGKQLVGIDLHRPRSVIVRMTASGERLDAALIVNDPMRLMAEIAKAGDEPEVVLEATYGWYWAADALTPKHYESDRTVRRGHITKQGSRLLRWAVVEAAQKVPADAGWLVATREGIRDRRGARSLTPTLRVAWSWS